MKLYVSDLIKNANKHLDIDINERIPDFDFSGEEIKFTQPVKIKGIIKNDSGILKMDAMIETEIELKCGRCASSVKYKLDTSISENFSNEEDVSDDVYKFNGKEIDLTNVVTEIIISTMPMKVVCKEDCKGFCGTCGKKLNEQQCNCKEEVYNPKFEKLLELKKEL